MRPNVPSVVTSCASSSGGSYSCQLQDTGGEWDVGAESVFLGHRKKVTEQVLEAVDPWQYRL